MLVPHSSSPAECRSSIVNSGALTVVALLAFAGFGCTGSAGSPTAEGMADGGTVTVPPDAMTDGNAVPTDPFDGGATSVDSGSDASTIPTDGGTRTDPVDASVEGTFRHGLRFILNGAGFGTRPGYGSGDYLMRAYDDCAADNPLDVWDQVEPSGGDMEQRLRCRTPAEVGPLKSSGNPAPATPHPRITRYLGASTWDPAPNARTAWNTTLTVYDTEVSRDFYASFLYRTDPDWHTASGSDGNHKLYTYGAGNGIYPTPGYYYFNFQGFQRGSGAIQFGVNYFGGHMFSACDGAGAPLDLHCVDETLVNWYVSGHDCGPGAGPPNTCAIFPKQSHPSHPSEGWIHIEYILRHGSDGTGFHEIRADNRKLWRVEIDDDTHGLSPATRSQTLGGYRRDSGSDPIYKNNWTYFADVYVDLSFARVMLADAAVYADATITVPQPIVSWTDARIELDARLGTLPSGSTAWLHVFDAAGRATGGGALLDVAVP